MPSDVDRNAREDGPNCGNSEPSAQEGLLLLQSFLKIKKEAVRKAIIDLVAELSKLDDESW